MIEFNIQNGDKLKKKAQVILKLQANKAKNEVKFTKALQELIKNPNLQAVLALCNEEFKFANDFGASVDGKPIALTKNYGIKGGKYIFYYLPHVRGKVVESDEEDLDGIGVAAPVVQVNTRRGNVEEKSRALRPSALIQEVMKSTLDVETVYNSWVSQLIAKGNELASLITDEEIEGEEVDDSLFTTAEDDEEEQDNDAIEESDEI